jgi:hypothetical protein
MRPLITPHQYIENLRKMFKGIIDETNSNVVNPSVFSNDKDNYSYVFCSETQKSIMEWLMGKIALQVSKMPEMQRNGPWKSERFYDTDVQLYEFTGDDKSSHYYKIIFNLYNPLRSTSTMVYAVVQVSGSSSAKSKDKIPKLLKISLINDQSMENSSMPGHNLPSNIVLPEALGFEDSNKGWKEWTNNEKSDPNEFDWNYMNTLEVQKFNKNGIHSNVPGENIVIKGGVPESLKKALRTSDCKDANLMSCMSPKYTGLTSTSIPAALNGSVKNVYVDPTITYSINNPIALRTIETPNGAVYI